MTRKFSAPLQSHTPSAESAPTRRSSRVSPAPAPAPSEVSGLSRAELRRRAQAAVAATVAAAPTLVEGATIEVVESAPVAPASDAPAALVPSSRRAARRAASAPLDAVRVPVEPFELVEPVTESTDAGPSAAASDPSAQAAASETTPEAEPFELVEPVVYAEPVADEVESIVDTSTDAPDVDEFEAAARLFSFTGENPVVTVDTDTEPESAPAEPVAAVRHVAPRRSRHAVAKRIVGASFSIGVMGVVGLLTVGMTTPAEAVARIDGNDITTSLRMAPGAEGEVAEEEEIQAYVAPSEVQNADISKAEHYSTVTMAEMAAQAGIKNVSNFFVNDPNADIQWPFAVGVPITYGFGMRSGAMHEGVDFVPGSGAPIQAIADGTVRVASEAGGGYGVHVIIDHVIDGQRVSSHYAHMIYGSIEVTEGQKVTVGTVLGRTGNTGRSFGAHTHFEILMNGTTPIDPIPWLRQHAGG